MIGELMNVPYGAKFKLANREAQVPPGAPRGDPEMVYSMGRLDGMYCNCTDSNGERCYFAAWEPVESPVNE